MQSNQKEFRGSLLGADPKFGHLSRTHPDKEIGMGIINPKPQECKYKPDFSGQCSLFGSAGQPSVRSCLGSQHFQDFEPLIPAEEAASLLGIHVKTLQLMAREGRIPGKRVGKFWRFRKSELDAWLSEGVNCPGYAYRPSKENKV